MGAFPNFASIESVHVGARFISPHASATERLGLINRAPTWTMDNRAPTWTMDNRAPTWTMDNRAPTWTMDNRAPTWTMDLVMVAVGACSKNEPPSKGSNT